MKSFPRCPPPRSGHPHDLHHASIRHRGRVLLLVVASLITANAFAQDLSELADEANAPWLVRDEAESGDEAEEPSELETDRDSFTPATTTVDPSRVVFESSYSFIENRSSANNHSFPEILTRFGMTERLEFRLGWNFEVGGGGSVSSGDPGGHIEDAHSGEESQALFGLKYAINRQSGWIPQSAVIIQGTVPTSGPDPFTDIQATYVFGWTFENDWQLDSSLRYLATSEEGDHHNIWAPSVVLKVPVQERWTAHAEYFVLSTDGRAEARSQHYFSPGVHYLITEDIEIGARFGWGLNQDAANFFSNVGLGWRF